MFSRPAHDVCCIASSAFDDDCKRVCACALANAGVAIDLARPLACPLALGRDAMLGPNACVGPHDRRMPRNDRSGIEEERVGSMAYGAYG